MSSLSPVWFAAVLALAALGAAALSWWQRRERTDLLYIAATLPWLVLVAASALAARSSVPDLDDVVTRLAYQCLIAGVAAFLLNGAHALGNWPTRALMVQTGAGLLLALGAAHTAYALAWLWFNTFFLVMLLAWLAAQVRHDSGGGVWMVLLASICGMGVMLTELHAAADGPVGVSGMHYFLLIALFALWRAFPPRHGGQASPSPARQERERMAQELHDGVGSQLTTLISALDAGTPRERVTAGALRECLFELKLLVDGADDEASVIGLLASLRYRAQPLLQAAGISLRWQIGDEAELEQVTGATAHDILRIAQECLANAVRHSGGTEVTLTLCRQRVRQALMLEVADNGSGQLDTGAPTPGGARRGRGLAGMRQRAARLGGELSVHSTPGKGTCVTLRVPLPPAGALARAAAA